MALAALIVCEASGFWAAALRRALGPRPLRVRETRRLDDCRSELAAAPAAVVALEWSCSRRAELADFVDRLGRRFPQAAVVVLADRAAAGDEPLARESGAAHFVRSPRELGGLLDLAWRRAAASGAEPGPADEWLARVWPADANNTEQGS